MAAAEAGKGGGKVEEFQKHPVKEQFPGVDYCVTSSPSWPEGIILGFQHFLVMIGAIIIISTLFAPLMGGDNVEKAQMIQTLLYVAGINTLVQTWRGTRLPVVVGASYAFVISPISIALSRRLSIYIDPHQRFKQSMSAIQGALTGLGLFVLGKFRSTFVLFWHPLLSTGTFVAASRYGSATPVPPSVLTRGIGWLGIGTLLDGFFGTGSGSTASVFSGLNTGWKSESHSSISRIYAFFFSVLGKFGAFLASIALPIVAALYCVLFAYVGMSDIKTTLKLTHYNNTLRSWLGLVQFCNLNSYRSMFILGFSLFMGLSVPQYFTQYLLLTGHGHVHTGSTAFNNIVQMIFSSPATVAIIVAYLLDFALGRGHSSTHRDKKFRNFNL